MAPCAENKKANPLTQPASIDLQDPPHSDGDWCYSSHHSQLGSSQPAGRASSFRVDLPYFPGTVHENVRAWWSIRMSPATTGWSPSAVSFATEHSSGTSPRSRNMADSRLKRRLLPVNQREGANVR
ncbi:hypothetical protein B0H14DRAFT_2594549 [Mycena olivaceomarginata]|nr:hypothetical protein B0H14DRAFT_2594549 [Mycena olivaceomarginata]